MMTRRMILLSALAPLARADSAQQVWDLFGDMAAALSAGNPQQFLTAFNKAMPGYNQLSVDVSALTKEFEIQNSVDFNKNEGDDQKRTVEADWLMTLRPVQDVNLQKSNAEVFASTSREKVLKCTVVKQGRKWRISSLDPADFFAPPTP
jgi:hypothetical protein